MEISESDSSARHKIPSPSSICHHHPSPPENGEIDRGPAESLVPPYWSHRRYESYSSVANTKPPPITLEDHTEEPDYEQSGAVWARGVTIDDEDYVLVSGSVPNVGSFVVWNCRIEMIDVGDILSFFKSG